ncbi:hypothetical protein ACFQ36_21180 [Arthrobacter sp. GCM10027362]|uniref:phosphoketolase family protein n=1 Tax=Arthrobacter sp. GCM10027362 TaxID=3273379 RepID=UPI003639207D
MQVLGGQLCQDWLDDDPPTGRHGVSNCCKAFVHVVDAMSNQHGKRLKARLVNVVELMRLQDPGEHPHGLPGRHFHGLVTEDPVIFARHGCPRLCGRGHRHAEYGPQAHPRSGQDPARLRDWTL